MDWLSPHFLPEDYAAVDVCIGAAFEHLRQDQRQRAIFGRQMFLQDVIPPDVGQLPALIVTPNSYTEITSPGVIIVDFSILVTARFVYPRNTQAAGAGLATLVNSWIKILNANGKRLLPVVISGTSHDRVTESRPGEGIVLQPLPSRAEQSDVVFDASLRWDYKAKVDPQTRKLWPYYITGT